MERERERRGKDVELSWRRWEVQWKSARRDRITNGKTRTDRVPTFIHIYAVEPWNIHVYCSYTSRSLMRTARAHRIELSRVKRVRVSLLPLDKDWEGMIGREARKTERCQRIRSPLPLAVTQKQTNVSTNYLLVISRQFHLRIAWNKGAGWSGEPGGEHTRSSRLGTYWFHCSRVGTSSLSQTTYTSIYLYRDTCYTVKRKAFNIITANWGKGLCPNSANSPAAGNSRKYDEHFFISFLLFALIKIPVYLPKHKVNWITW